jgi:hypothetical protein
MQIAQNVNCSRVNKTQERTIYSYIIKCDCKPPSGSTSLSIWVIINPLFLEGYLLGLPRCHLLRVLARNVLQNCGLLFKGAYCVRGLAVSYFTVRSLRKLASLPIFINVKSLK